MVAAAAATRVVAEVPAAAAIKAEGEEGEVPHTRRELAQLPLLLRARIAGTTQMIQGLIRDTRAEGTTVQAAGTEAPAATATSVSHGLEHSAPSVRSAA